MDYNQPNPPEQPPPGGPPTPPPYQPYGQPGQPPPPQPPYAPPQQPYAPPPQPYPPQQPYMPQQPYPPQVPPYGGYAPPPQKRGTNWLAICGITCVVLVIVIIGCTWLFVRPFVAMGLEIGKIAQTVATTDIATIKAAAKPATTQELAANPANYKGQWVELTGVIAGTQVPGANDPFSKFNKEGGTAYYLDQGIMLQDLSQKPPLGQTGSPVRAWGQVAYVDVAKMPFIKKAFEEEMKKDPNAAIPPVFVMFFAKELEVTGSPAPTPAPGEAPAGTAPPAGEGQVRGWN